MAAQGNAPRALQNLSRRGVPVGVSALVTDLCVALNDVIPGEAFGMLMGLAVSALIINWGMISWIHLRFRATKRAARGATGFPSPAAPLSNHLCLSVSLIPVWLAVPGVGYWLRQRRAAALAQVAEPVELS